MLSFAIPKGETFHSSSIRSETKSALRLSPFRSPVLLGGALIALLLHFGTMFVPLGQDILHVEPVSLTTFACLWALALSVFVAMEVHKWTWAMREQRGAPPR